MTEGRALSSDLGAPAVVQAQYVAPWVVTLNSATGLFLCTRKDYRGGWG